MVIRKVCRIPYQVEGYCDMEIKLFKNSKVFKGKYMANLTV